MVDQIRGSATCLAFGEFNSLDFSMGVLFADGGALVIALPSISWAHCLGAVAPVLPNEDFSVAGD
jgi:hypothetical protein